MPPLRLTDPLAMTFVLIPVGLVIALAAGVQYAWRRDGRTPDGARKAAVLTFALGLLWMAVTWLIADNGLLREWDRRPPPMAFLFVVLVGLALLLSATRVGAALAKHVPLWLLVGVQGFRWPLEMAMHGMAERGVMPAVMSYSGRNFDIVSGITAVVVAVAVRQGWAGRGWVTAWNLLGLALLVNIIGVALLATPMVQYFGPDQLNVWVTYPPYVWLPSVMVMAALVGHLIVARALRLGVAPARR